MNMLRKIYYALGPKQRRWARKMFYVPQDIIDTILKRRPPLVPPKGKIFIGQGNFVATGDALLQNLIETCLIKPNHYILDVGCGIGRLARPLAGFLNSDGAYEGFDVVEDGINWCKKNYAHYSNFSFQYIPLRNDLYNLETENTANVFKFPYPDQYFDLVVLTSVFTHMQLEDVKNYINEIGRILKPGGHCFSTFFIINQQTESFLDQSKNPFFPYRFDQFFLHNPKVKDANIAYRYEVVKNMVSKAGLALDQFHPGWWAGKPENTCMNFQDVLVLKKLV